MTHHTQKKGFALFLAVVVMSILLAASLATVDITVKELNISSSGRDSQYAFYAADAGIECASYWDQDPSTFKPSGGTVISCDFNPIHPGNNTINVVKSIPVPDSNSIPNNFPPIMSGYNVSSSTFSFTFAEGYFTEVTVMKKIKPASGTPGQAGYTPELSRTRIESRGYNTASKTNPRRVERGIKVIY